VIHCYGPTETTTFALTHEVRRVEAGARSIPLGRPIGNTRVYLLDRADEPVPVGVAGELYLGGVGVARGVVRFRGVYEDEEAKRAAHVAAENIPGVRGIEDDRVRGVDMSMMG
jgi:acyl-coenzyme A synthetase/AMP-(fatty) acid ligase